MKIFNLKERFDPVTRFSFVLIAGATIGAIGVHRYETLPILDMAVRGLCIERGIQTVMVNTYGWYDCQTTAMARAIQASDAQRDAEMATALSEDEAYRAGKLNGKRGKKP